MMDISKLYDKDKQTKGIQYAINLCEQYSMLFPKERRLLTKSPVFLKHKGFCQQSVIGCLVLEAPNYDARLGCIDSNLETRGVESLSFHFSKSI